MMGGWIEWQDRQVEEEVADSVEGMVAPSVEEVAELSEVHRKTY